ncbi:MJ1255/VC2487 family glycosyltransferase [Parashewanella tropica]|uniref:MJ1255/VC2487 family glycosyltransferase n=1 Tax=Parashewanella tropica TaxID=2547970 RepID=UPI0010593AED|nr:MJ1255/VC2487 family glycosyltransferase [Parashewanella tropica]
MRILYGVQGTGNGHLSRARVMASALQEHGLHVDYLFSGRPREQFFNMDEFGDFRCLKGMTFSSAAGKLQIGKTIKQNMSRSILQDIESIDLTNYDVVLNDYEPVTAWAAKNQGVPAIGISHQAALLHAVPKSGTQWFSDLMLKYFAPVDVALGCHWHHFGFPILPPFVDVTEVDGEFPHQILVYLPFESPGDIIELLKPYNGYQFLVYHKDSIEQELPSHITWHGFDRLGFKRHLASCGGVICNAGFELVSEALTLGKKILVKPLLGQFEQHCNVAALELLAAADAMMTLDPQILSRWLKKANPQPIEYPQVADALVDWLQQGDWDNQEVLSKQLWQQVTLPDSWR